MVDAGRAPDVMGRGAPSPGRRRGGGPGSLVAAARRHRRVLAGLAAVAIAGGAVAVSRAGLDDPDATARATGPSPIPGRAVLLAADQAVFAALVEDCPDATQSCARTVVVSQDGGTSWQQRATLRSGPQVDDTSWRMSVSGPVLQLEDSRAGRVYYSADGGRNFLERPISDGPAQARMPMDVTGRVFLCPPVDCAGGALAYVDGRTGQQHRLSAPLPFTATAVRTEPGYVWITGSTEPRGGRYATAVSRDGGASWRTTVLSAAKVDPDLTLEVVPLPGRASAYFVSGYPSEQGFSVYDVWLVPAPDGRRAPLQVSPERSLRFNNGIGLDDGCSCSATASCRSHCHPPARWPAPTASPETTPSSSDDSFAGPEVGSPPRHTPRTSPALP